MDIKKVLTPTGEFDIKKFNEEYNKKEKQREEEQKKKDEEKLKQMNKEKIEYKNLYELSIGEILIGFKNEMFGIITDLLFFRYKSFDGFIEVFTKNNRLFYIGLLILFSVLIIYLTTSFTNKNKKIIDNAINDHKVYNIYNTYNYHELPKNKLK